MKTPFLKWLDDEIKAITTIPQTGEPVAEGERVLGVLSDYCQRLYTVYSKVADSINAEIEAHYQQHETGTCTRESCASFRESLVSRKKEVNHLEGIFWFEARREFDAEKISNVGIREGFNLVVCVEEEKFESPLGELFGDFLLSGILGRSILGGISRG